MFHLQVTNYDGQVNYIDELQGTIYEVQNIGSRSLASRCDAASQLTAVISAATNVWALLHPASAARLTHILRQSYSVPRQYVSLAEFLSPACAGRQDY